MAAILNHEIIRNQDTKSEWLLLIHGAGGSIRTWKRQRESLSEFFNLLIVDLPGHGGSADLFKGQNQYSFEYLSKVIWETVDHLKLKHLHIGGVSLGTIIALKMKDMQPTRVKSLVLVGAIVKLNRKLRLVAKFSLSIAKMFGYEAFYKLGAKIALPKKNHKKSRDIFIRESKFLTKDEFRKWTELYGNYLNITLNCIYDMKLKIPALLVMGEQDHLFLKIAKRYVKKQSNAYLSIVEKCGHVVSIERATQFNEICLRFLNGLPVVKSTDEDSIS